MKEQEKIVKYSFGISGAPVAKARPFGYRAKSGKTIFFTPTKTKNFEHLVRERAEKEIKKPMQGPVSIEIVFFLPRPQRLMWKKRPMPVVPAPKKPDIDNLAKTILDGLRGVAFIDDNQITIMHLYKRYHAGDRGPWTQIDIEEDILGKEAEK
jgi:Holliday junction resolvase RusA-like endonuclease